MTHWQLNSAFLACWRAEAEEYEMMADSVRAEEDEKILLELVLGSRDKVLFRKMDVLLRVSLHEEVGRRD